MAGEIVSTTTTLNDLIAPIVAEAQFVATEKSIMRGLVKNFVVPKNSGTTLQIPVYGTPAAADLTEADDLTASAVSTSVANITLAEIGLMTNVSDLSLNFSPTNVIADVGRLFGEAIAKKIDQKCIALFDGFSETLGGASVAMTTALLFRAIAVLRSNSVPSTDLACVLHPNIAYDLKASMTNTFGTGSVATTDIGNEAMRTGFVGTVAGVPVYETSAMLNTGTTGDYKGAVFHRDAIALAIGSDIKIATQRDESARATELVGTATVGVVELHNSYGIEMENDSSIK